MKLVLWFHILQLQAKCPGYHGWTRASKLVRMGDSTVRDRHGLVTVGPYSVTLDSGLILQQVPQEQETLTLIPKRCHRLFITTRFHFLPICREKKDKETHREEDSSGCGDDLIAIIPAALWWQEPETLSRCFREPASATGFLKTCCFVPPASVLQPSVWTQLNLREWPLESVLSVTRFHHPSKCASSSPRHLCHPPWAVISETITPFTGCQRAAESRPLPLFYLLRRGQTDTTGKVISLSEITPSPLTWRDELSPHLNDGNLNVRLVPPNSKLRASWKLFWLASLLSRGNLAHLHTAAYIIRYCIHHDVVCSHCFFFSFPMVNQCNSF